MDEDGANKLREILAACDAACPVCGYSLHGLTAAVCPECGKPVSMVAARRWYQFTRAEWVFVAGTGWSAAAIVTWVIVVFVTARDALAFLALFVPAAMLIVLVIVCLAWLIGLKRVARSSRWIAVANAIATWGVGTAGFAFLIWIAVQ